MSLLFWGGANDALVQGTILGQSGLAGGVRTVSGQASGRGGLVGVFRVDLTLDGTVQSVTDVVGSFALLTGTAFGRAALAGTMDFAVDPPCCLEAAAVYLTGLADASVYVPGLRAETLVC